VSKFPHNSPRLHDLFRSPVLFESSQVVGFFSKDFFEAHSGNIDARITFPVDVVVLFLSL
jgi:hypothetical protein